MCWGLTIGTPTPKGVGVEVMLPRMARVSQERPWMSRWDGASVGASLRMFQGGEASDGASSCESSSNQGEFQDGGASVWASSSEFQW